MERSFEQEREMLHNIMAEQINYLFVAKLRYASLVLPDCLTKHKQEGGFMAKYDSYRRKKEIAAILKDIDDTVPGYNYQINNILWQMHYKETSGREVFPDVFPEEDTDFVSEFDKEIEDYYAGLQVLKDFYVEDYLTLQGFQIDFANYRDQLVHRFGLEKAMQRQIMYRKSNQPPVQKHTAKMS